MIAFVWATRDRAEHMRRQMQDQLNIRHFVFGDNVRGYRFEAAILMEPIAMRPVRVRLEHIDWVLNDLKSRLPAGVEILDGQYEP